MHEVYRRLTIDQLLLNPLIFKPSVHLWWRHSSHVLLFLGELVCTCFIGRILNEMRGGRLRIRFKKKKKQESNSIIPSIVHPLLPWRILWKLFFGRGLMSPHIYVSMVIIWQDYSFRRKHYDEWQHIVNIDWMNGITVVYVIYSVAMANSCPLTTGSVTAAAEQASYSRSSNPLPPCLDTVWWMSLNELLAEAWIGSCYRQREKRLRCEQRAEESPEVSWL